MPLDDEKGNAPAGVNGEGTKGNALSGRQDQVTPDARRAEPVLRSYIAAGYELIALNLPEARDKKGRPIGKAPMYKNWRTMPALSLKKAIDHMERFGNIGVRLRPTDLVVDVDPRNFLPGDDPLARLEKDTGVALREICPTVVTGSGGLHLYLRKPADAAVRDSLEEYQGVEFKTFGRQVVAPESIHPDGGVYVLTMADVLSIPVPIDRAPEASAGLLGMIRRPDVYQGDQEAGDVEPERLAAMLEVLDPTEFKDHDTWLGLMMACHHATGGDGRTEFLVWTTSDPEYAEQTWSIGRRWDSLKADNNGKRYTKKTLSKHVIDAGKKAGIDHGHLLPQEHRATAQEDFAEFIEGEVVEGEAALPEVRPPHERGLTVNGRDIAPDILSNAMAAVHLVGILPAYNELKQEAVFRGKLPWEESFGRTLDDHTNRRLRGVLIRRFQGSAFEPSSVNVFEACLTLAYEKRFNPVIDYLDGLAWDGVPRVEGLFSRYFGVADDAYSRAVSRCFVVAAVRRQRRPGVKFDTMPVLRGRQGTGKSTGVKALFGADWFSDADLGDLKNKDAVLQLGGIWGQEMAELQGLRRVDLLTLKAFCSRTVDRVRPPYGRSSIDVPRRCVFIGTTNEGGYLTDPTGNRRFWPLEVLAEVDVEALRRDRDQLWAEASALEAQGVSIVLDQGLWDLAAERQAEETTEDPWADLVRQYIDGLRASEAAWEAGEEETAPVVAIDRVHTLRLFEEALRIPEPQRSGVAAQRLKAVMTEALGWSHRKSVRVGDKVAAGFVRWPQDKGPMPTGTRAPY